MKWVVAFLLVLTGPLGPDSSRATEIQGKWGLGVSVGSLFSSGAEASIIRGRSARTAWIGDIVVNVNSDHRTVTTDLVSPYPDTTLVGGTKNEHYSIEVGPRLRRFAAPGSSFSPYGDVYAHFFDTTARLSSPSSSESATQMGGKIGIAIGAEYFSTRWPFSVAVHTDVVAFTALHESGTVHIPGRVEKTSGTNLSGLASLHPVVQVRVYW